MIIIINFAGFFSNYLKALSWRICSNNEEKVVPYYLDRGLKFITVPSHTYLDKNIYNDKENIWEVMFEPFNTYTKAELNDTNNTHVMNYPNNWPHPLNQMYMFGNYKLYYSEHFNKIRYMYNDVIKEMKLTPFLRDYVEKAKTVLKNPENTIAVFIRGPAHFFRNNYTYIDHIISELDILIKENNYEHIFLVTMIDIFYAKVVEKFKEKVIVVEDKRYTSVDKDWGDKDWDHGSNSYLQESLDSYTEVYIASQCKFVIGGASNMLLGCLFMNPNINFKLFDCLQCDSS